MSAHDFSNHLFTFCKLLLVTKKNSVKSRNYEFSIKLNNQRLAVLSKLQPAQATKIGGTF